MRLRRLIALAGIVCGFQNQVMSMDGMAFSASLARGEHVGAWEGTWPYIGAIVRYTIRNDAVTACDTIYNEFWAGYPIVNVQGTMVAFERQTLRGGSDTLTSNNRNRYLSVMDINGNNARDLDILPEDNSGMGKRIFICWPAGDYIYYHYNTAWASDNGPISEIRKVKFDDPSQRQKIFTYEDVKTFALSLDAARASITSIVDGTPFVNIPHAFPPTSEPLKGSWSWDVLGGCGSYLFASGTYHHHFSDGGHGTFRINRIELPNEVLSSVDVNFDDVASWSPMPKDSIAGGNFDWSRTAANSDKWICAAGRNKIGATNQLLIDWVDHVTINTSRNSKLIGSFVPASDPGALWVAGGPCGSYEDVNGNWVATGVEGGCDAAGVARSHLKVGFGGDRETHKVNVYTVQGRLLGTFSPGKISRCLPSGTYFVQPVSGANGGVARAVLGENEVHQ